MALPESDIDLAAAADVMQPAANGQITSRQLFVRKLTDIIVLPAGQISGNERCFAADILIRTLNHVDTTIRAEVALRLAGIGEIPRHLQRYLLTCDIAIAGPLLEARTSLSPSLLMEAAECGFDHRWLIVQRDDVTAPVADVLVRFGEADILRCLLKNDEVELSDRAMTTLVEKSRDDETIRDPLMQRLELRCDHAFVMYWWMNTRQRKHLLKRFTIDRSALQDAMHELFRITFTSDNPDLVVKSNLRLIDRRHRPRGRNGEMVTMEIVIQTLKAAWRQPSQEFSHAVGLLAGVSQETADMVLYDARGESFAILCKSIGVSRQDFHDILTDATYGQPASPELSDPDKLDDLVGIFDSITRDFSRTILRYWNWKGDRTIGVPFSPLMQEDDDAYFGAL